MQERQLLEGPLGVGGSGRRGELGRQLLAFKEAGDGEVGLGLRAARSVGPRPSWPASLCACARNLGEPPAIVPARAETRHKHSRERQSMPSTVILGTARTPFGKMGGTLSSLDATDLGGHVDRGGAGALRRRSRAGRPGRLRPGAPGRPGADPLAPGPDQGRHPQGGPLGDGQQGLRVGHALDRHRRPRDPRRRHRGGGDRRHGVDEPGPLPAARRPLRLSHGRRQRRSTR